MQYMSFDGITFIFLDDNHWFFLYIGFLQESKERERTIDISHYTSRPITRLKCFLNGYRKKLNSMHPMVGFQIGTSTNPNLTP